MSRLGRNRLAGVSFDWRAAMNDARERLSQPAPLDRIQRPARRGELVQSFALPLEFCLGTNRTRHSRPGQHADLKKSILALLQVQCRIYRARSPLPGIPLVLCTRFSSTEPDRYADWAKMPIDLLCLPTKRRPEGLGFLRDDRPKDAEVHQWWEPAPRGNGFVYLEIRA